MSPKRRITKHEMKEDQFVNTVFRAREWALQNLNLILIGAAIVVAVIAVAWYLSARSAGHHQESYELLAKAEMEVRDGKPQLATVDFEKLLSDYGSSPAAKLGAFELANTYFEQNQFEKAEEAYKTYIAKYLIDDVSKYSAMEGIAASQSGQGKFADAGASYLEVAKENPTSISYENDLFHAVENFIKAGDEQGARDAFSLLEEKGITSEQYRNAKIMMIENGFLSYDEGDFD